MWISRLMLNGEEWSAYRFLRGFCKKFGIKSFEIGIEEIIPGYKVLHLAVNDQDEFDFMDQTRILINLCNDFNHQHRNYSLRVNEEDFKGAYTTLYIKK